jgi:hypothetical protein
MESLSVPGGQDEEFIDQLCQQVAFAMALSAFDLGSAGVANPIAVVSNECTGDFGDLWTLQR